MPADCTYFNETKSNIEPYDFAFYDIASGIMHGVMKKISDESLEKIGRLIAGNASETDTGGTIALGIVKEQWAVILLAVVGLVCALFSCIGACIVGIPCICRKQKSVTKEKTPVILLLVSLPVLLLALALTLVAVGSYGVATSDLFEAIETSPVVLGNITSSFVAIVTILPKQLDCHATDVLNGIIKEVDSLDGTIKQFPDDIINQIADVKHFKEIVAGVKAKVEEAEKSPIAPAISVFTKQVKHDVDELNKKLEDVEKIEMDIRNESRKMSDGTTKAKESLRTERDKIKSVFTRVTNATGTAQKTVDDFQRNFTKNLQDQIHASGGAATQNAVKTVLMLILLVCGILLLAGILLAVFRLIKNSTPASERSCLSNAFGHVLLIGGGIVLFWMVMAWLCASVLFGVSSTVSVLCDVIVDDPEMRLYNMINISLPISEEPFVINAKSFLQECKNGEQSLISALGFTDLDRTTKNMKDGLSTLNKTRKSIDDLNIDLGKLNLEEFKHQLDDINAQLRLLEEVQKKTPHPQLKELIDQLTATHKDMSDLHTKLAEPGFGGTIKEKIKQQAFPLIKDFETNVIKTIDTFNRNVETKTVSCKDFYVQFEDVGKLLCHRVALPLMGIWAASGLGALVSIIAIVGLCFASRGLFRLDEGSRRSRKSGSKKGTGTGTGGTQDSY